MKRCLWFDQNAIPKLSSDRSVPRTVLPFFRVIVVVGSITVPSYIPFRYDILVASRNRIISYTNVPTLGGFNSDSCFILVISLLLPNDHATRCRTYDLATMHNSCIVPIKLPILCTVGACE